MRPGTAADVYALGAAVYEAVEGVLRGTGSPRHGGPLTGLIERLLATEPRRRPAAAEASALFGAVAAGRRY
ncbi:hypothetical protein [Pseudonocardia sp. GCM10023141]|uniref:hypothetical protein n=1 Tax=Pseudonocardia sp. GCM10023141 TaxID=3252653 RepID=UPI003608ED02